MVKRLGKGLNAIIAAHQDEEPGGSGVAAVPIALISANPYQPRQKFDDDSLAELTESIRQKGVITPITVRADDGRYILIAGERRWRAAQLAGLKEIPAYVIEVTGEADMMEVALVENIQRENLNPIEEAEAYAVLCGKYDLSQEAVAQAVGKKRVTVTNALRLLKLPPDIKRSLRAGAISAGHGRALLGLPSSAAQLKLWQRIVREEWSVRATEAEVQKSAGRPAAPARKKTTPTPQLQKVEEELMSLLGTRVKLKSASRGGSINITYFSAEDLERILDLLRSIPEN